MMKKSVIISPLIFIILAGLISISYAQAPEAELPQPSPAAASDPATVMPAAVAAAAAASDNVRFQGSLFLTPLEIAAIRMAMTGDGAKADALSAMMGVGEGGAAAVPVPPNRVIRISGMLYRKAGDWIVWMNGHKVTPKSLLPEIVDIKVENSSYVDLKWFDQGLNGVISIRLRPHQVYDIDTGILLPSK